MKSYGTRRSIRLHQFQYDNAGYYFVTICTQHHACTFGKISNERNGAVRCVLNEYGRIAESCWNAIADHFNRVLLDAFIVMPNHLHGIVIITDRGGTIIPDQCSTSPEPVTISPEQVTISPEQVPTSPEQGTACRAPTSTFEEFGSPVHGSLPTIVRSYKSAVAKIIHEHGMPDFKWQRSFYDRVIRSDDELNAIRQYIDRNPLEWEHDEYCI